MQKFPLQPLVRELDVRLRIMRFIKIQLIFLVFSFFNISESFSACAAKGQIQNYLGQERNVFSYKDNRGNRYTVDLNRMMVVNDQTAYRVKCVNVNGARMEIKTPIGSLKLNKTSRGLQYTAGFRSGILIPASINRGYIVSMSEEEIKTFRKETRKMHLGLMQKQNESFSPKESTPYQSIL